MNHKFTLKSLSARQTDDAGYPDEDDLDAVEMPMWEINKDSFFQMLIHCEDIDLKNIFVNNFKAETKLPDRCAVKRIFLDSCSINCLTKGSKPSLTHFYSFNNKDNMRI